MDERAGRDVLRRCFGEAGLVIREDVPFETAHGRVHLDGYDEERRIGYEYITTEAGDRAELTPEVVADLEARMIRGEIFVLLVDEADVTGPEDLVFATTHFLGALRKRGVLS
jgi:hypothetical protein